MSKVLRILVVALFALLVVCGSYLAGFATAYLTRPAGVGVSGFPGIVMPTPLPTTVPTPPARAPVPKDLEKQFQVFWETWDLVYQEYYGKSGLDSQQMIYGAVRGMLNSLGDPHTAFLDPEQNRITSEDMTGRFEGIGASIEKKGDNLLIVAPMDDSPAMKAGLRSGDIIAQVDGKETAPLSVMEAVSLIRGPKGTTVTLTIVREGVEAPFEVKVVRAEIKFQTVTWKMLEGQVAYVKLSNNFGQETAADLAKALSEAKTQGAKSWILDLRNNPGGYLDTAIQVASQFLKSGLVLYEQTGDGQRQPFPVRRGGLATDLPMVVLVNSYSASASEIVAGALQDAGRAVLIGEKTFGKGSVQNVHDLSDGSSAHITIAHWLTPNGREINGQGLQPNIEVKLTDDDTKNNRDPQLDRALEYLKTGK
jgi:carboxyl-terminal processing protease